MRVRHKQFGVGTVLDVEDQGDDIKVTVRFAAVGTKKLLARYADSNRRSQGSRRRLVRLTALSRTPQLP